MWKTINLHQQPRQSQRLYGRIHSSQTSELYQRRKGPHPTPEIHAEITDSRRKLPCGKRRNSIRPSSRCAPNAAQGQTISPLTSLKVLGARAKQEPVGIFNLSFSTGKSPQIWKITIILSPMKAGEPSGCFSSYSPVSLASCVAKPLESILQNRPYYLVAIHDVHVY